MRSTVIFVFAIVVLTFIYAGSVLAAPDHLLPAYADGPPSIIYLQGDEEPPTSLPPITPVVDDYQLTLEELYEQAEAFLMLAAFGIITILKWVLPKYEVKTETIYLWVVAGAGVIYGILTLLGVAQQVPLVLQRLTQPAQILLELLVVLVGPSVVYGVTRLARTPFFGDNQSDQAFHTERPKSSRVIAETLYPQG